MKKLLFITFLTFLLISGYLLLNKNNSTQTKTTKLQTDEGKAKKEVSIKTAKFKIVTNGTTRIFTESKYHNQNENVFIEKNDPNTIIINGENIMWSDFFNSLPSPMKLTKECLTTGTGQKFCNSNNKKLFFYLNNNEDLEVLDKTIKDNDNLLIEYK